MVQINFARKEINCKLVFYGPGLSGKTTNLEKVHERTPEKNKGELTSISTDGDRTLFFDFMPLDLGEIAGMKTKFHLYTVPGQVYYNSTRKLVLLGADGVIFVADSSRSKLDENKESLENLRENLAEMGKDMTKFPLVLQWNKRDMEDAMTVEELEAELNPLGVPSFEAIAYKGEGVFQTLKALSALVLKNINSSDASSRMSSQAMNTLDSVEKASTTPPAPAADSGSGMMIERNQVPSGPSAASSPTSSPPVSHNPMDEVAVAASHAAPVAASNTPPKAAPQSAPAAVATKPAPKAAPKRDEVMANQMKRHPSPAKEETLRREVKVVGAPAGARRGGGGGGAGMIVGIVVVVAAAAAAWYLLS